MVVLILRPEVLSLSYNPVTYRLHTDIPINTAGLAIEVALYFAGLDGEFSQVFFQPLYPNGDGYVTFQPQAILNAFLEYHPPVPSNKVSLMAAQSGRFYLEYREVTTAAASGAWQSDADHVRYVIKGGLAYERWTPTVFSAWLGAQKPFLTWQQSGRLCGKKETMFLYFLLAEAATSLEARIRVVFSDLSEKETVVLFPDHHQYGVYAIGTGIEQLGITEAAGKPIYFFEVSVWAENTVMAYPYRYFPDNRASYNTTQFNYVNSLGGCDSIRFLGTIESDFVRDLQLGGATPPIIREGASLYPQTTVQSVKTNTNFKGDVGFLGKKEQHYLLDLFTSRHVWEPRYGKWIPVVITSKSIPQPKSDDMLFSMPVEWQYGWDNNKFTPNFVSI